MLEDQPTIHRDTCYKCYRPKSSCMCSHIHTIDTHTQFIILMHPKEYRKTKNGTGHLTHLSLKNSKLFIGIDFSNHKEINALINNDENNCFILYPDANAIELDSTSIYETNKRSVIFIIDSTWPCSKKMIRESKNLRDLPKVSFTFQKGSQFHIKTQPTLYALSTIESTLTLLKHLNNHKIENISTQSLEKFLTPFHKMVEYQVNCASHIQKKKVRYKKPFKKKTL